MFVVLGNEEKLVEGGVEDVGVLGGEVFGGSGGVAGECGKEKGRVDGEEVDDEDSLGTCKGDMSA